MVTVAYILTKGDSVVDGVVKLLKIIISVTNGDKDFLRDDMEYFIYHLLD